MASIKDVVNHLAAATGLTKKDSLEIAETVLGAITKITAEGDSLIIRGFGTFKLKESAARKCRNPQTGGVVEVAAKTRLVFKAAKA